MSSVHVSQPPPRQHRIKGEKRLPMPCHPARPREISRFPSKQCPSLPHISRQGALGLRAMASGGGRRRPKPRARARGKAKKTKYLSLSDLIKAEVGTPPPGDGREDEPAPPPPWEEAEVKQEEHGGGGGGGGGAAQQQHMEPFALHHEASTLFAALAAPSLSEILGGGVDELPSPSPSASPDGGSGFPGAEEEDLARRALRGRERWVYCSSGSSPAATATTTATTSSSSPCSSAASTGASARSLLLKLDYEEILAAWADRGPLYIGGGGGADAPEQELDAVLVEVEVDVEPSERAVAAAAAFAWSSPDTAATARPGRAERVRRYKEKRRNRLFAKRIRYEVRRVNAVKRPRFKGRFIREHEESELQPT